MGYEVALTPSARRDLRAIVRTSRRIRPSALRGLVSFASAATISRIEGSLNSGTTRPSRESREAFGVRSYRVIDRVDHGDRRIDVARFWHAARGTPKIEGI